MVAIGHVTLKRNLALAAVLTAGLSGCASVDSTSEAELSAVQTTVPVAKPGTEVGYATAAAADTQATGTGMVTTTAALDTSDAAANKPATMAYATQTTSTATTALATATNDTATTTVVATSEIPTETAAQSMTASYAEMPLTDEVTAIQSVIPMKRPGSELAYAATTTTPTRTAFTSMNSMLEFDTRPVSAIQPASLTFQPSVGIVETGNKGPLKELISKYAKLYEVPEALVHRVVKRESTYNPKAFAHGNYGLMQIRYNTAKAMGYEGPASGLFDAETNLKYAVKYLRGAWITADTDHDGAVKLYSTGYYYTAKRKGLLNQVQ
ncbi:transglycosylase [Metarhizobium album]|uniref:Transglycosylase n=1 Tax=Metarhizobium album TaxID=2182425 RepID=A0A2U2DME8_9HYPH|nr:lytic transglycosylase domain-containing protein [Rhizobium album]PWE54497.1 transglycosylase [Rhizobium album]